MRSVWSPGLATPAPWWHLDARKLLTISYIRPIANTYSQLSKALLNNSQQTSSGWKPVSDGNTYCLQEKCTNEGATNQSYNLTKHHRSKIFLQRLFGRLSKEIKCVKEVSPKGVVLLEDYLRKLLY